MKENSIRRAVREGRAKAGGGPHRARSTRPTEPRKSWGFGSSRTRAPNSAPGSSPGVKNRGVEDVLIAVVDGLKGFPQAITAVFPQATVQTPDRVRGRLCIVHLLRNSLDFVSWLDVVSWKDRKPVAAALKAIYRAVDAGLGKAALNAFEESFWGQKYPAIGQSWRRAWGEIIPFYAFPGDVRRILYTTNAIEALNAKLRRAVRARGHFPSDEAATKLLFLVLNRSEKEWIMPPREWAMAKSQFAVAVRRALHSGHGLISQPARPRTKFPTVPALVPARPTGQARGLKAHDQPTGIGFHQDLQHPLRHGAQEIAIAALLQQLDQRHSVVGHRVLGGCWWLSQIHLSAPPGDHLPLTRAPGCM